MLVSNLKGGQSEDLAGDSEMHGEVGSSGNIFCPADFVAGSSGDHIRTLVAAVVLAAEKWVNKLYSATASISLAKNTTSLGR